MKKILVLVQNYPNPDGGVALMYVHVRNKYYIQHGIDVTVLNFSATKGYALDGIKVITESEYKSSDEKYDIVVSHAANVKNHHRFLKKYGARFDRMIFFFHGHEVLRLNEAYPKPYDYVKQSRAKALLQDLYDSFKLSVWSRYYQKNAYKSDFIFVSNWLRKQFQKNTHLTDSDLCDHAHIINNSVGKAFETGVYKHEGEKKYDFITIRSFMDKSTYCIDLLEKLARKYPEYRFLVIGRGDYFKVHEIPENVTWIEKYLSHDEMLDYINSSKCGLMLTRNDTQGVMTCELSEYGLPVITSDIEVCEEIFGDLKNVGRISNDISKVDLKNEFDKLTAGVPYEKQGKFSYQNTVKLEEELICSL